MLKSKILLTILGIVSIAGGALGYKANRVAHVFYLDTTIMFQGAPLTVCSVATTYTLTQSPVGVRTIKASTMSINQSCPVISVIPSL
ncbi:hypothetical protein SAMN04488122_5770 [Chitinophaga arvensicola]|uniref:Uncharacterized protein n=1 Tax=Chitinophaga arvensicola TaxID=29529 RepID=A0A1I0SB76_9BACT|nr:hypothetical protein SAMN04488122_5770 [Chitinophaga arvensicola]